MANIDTYLTKIKTAIYGEDVRGSIHDAIKECYTNVTNAETLANTAATKADTATANANTAATRANQAAASAENFTGLIAPAFSASKTYKTNDYVTYNGSLYRCINAINEPTEFSTDYWLKVTLSEDVNQNDEALIEELRANADSLENNYSEGAIIAIPKRAINTDGTIIELTRPDAIISEEITIPVGCYKIETNGTCIESSYLDYAIYDDNHMYISGDRRSLFKNEASIREFFKYTIPISGNEKIIRIAVTHDVYIKFFMHKSLTEHTQHRTNTNFTNIVESDNLFDNLASFNNMRITANNGQVVRVDNYIMTDLIEISDCEYIVEKINTGSIVTCFFAQFDKDRKIIIKSNMGYTSVFTPDEGTRYVVVSIPGADSIDDFYMHPTKEIKLAPSSKIKLDDRYIFEIGEDEISFKSSNTQYSNIASKFRDKVFYHKILDQTGYYIIDHPNVNLNPYFIPVEPSTKYVMSFVGDITSASFFVWEYDSDFNCVVYQKPSNNFEDPYETTENTSYIRICVTSLSYATNGHDDFTGLIIIKNDVRFSYHSLDLFPSFNNIFPFTSLKNKKWTVFGDSITESNIRSFANYHDFIRSEIGITVLNKGVGGSGYKNRYQNGNAFWQIALNSVDEWKDSDIITCFGGINDSWSEMSRNLGEYSDAFDESSIESNSVMACVNKMIDVIEEYAPFARIGILFPLPCYYQLEGGKFYDYRPDDDSNVLSLFVKEMKKLCKSRGLPYLDLFHESGLRPWIAECNDKFFKTNAADSPDGLHPNYYGHQFIYPMIREFIKTLG